MHALTHDISGATEIEVHMTGVLQQMACWSPHHTTQIALGLMLSVLVERCGINCPITICVEHKTRVVRATKGKHDVFVGIWLKCDGEDVQETWNRGGRAGSKTAAVDASVTEVDDPDKYLIGKWVRSANAHQVRPLLRTHGQSSKQRSRGKNGRLLCLV